MKQKHIALQPVPIAELALMYIKAHSEALETPEDYVERFVEVRRSMVDAYERKLNESLGKPPAVER